MLPLAHAPSGSGVTGYKLTSVVWCSEGGGRQQLFYGGPLAGGMVALAGLALDWCCIWKGKCYKISERVLMAVVCVCLSVCVCMCVSEWQFLLDFLVAGTSFSHERLGSQGCIDGWEVKFSRTPLAVQSVVPSL